MIIWITSVLPNKYNSKNQKVELFINRDSNDGYRPLG
jgi:hypothetical protein